MVREAAARCGEHLCRCKQTHAVRTNQGRHKMRNNTISALATSHMCVFITTCHMCVFLVQQDNKCYSNMSHKAPATRHKERGGHLQQEIKREEAICNKTQAIGNNICNKRSRERRQERRVGGMREEAKERRQETREGKNESRRPCNMREYLATSMHTGSIYLRLFTRSI